MRSASEPAIPALEAWYVFGKDKYKFELGGGCTGVIAPGLYPLLRSGQINGLIGGLRGAAEYESLIGQKGKCRGRHGCAVGDPSCHHRARHDLQSILLFASAPARPEHRSWNGDTEMPIEATLGAWMATGLTLFIFSFLYKDNPLFKLAETSVCRGVGRVYDCQDL